MSTQIPGNDLYFDQAGTGPAVLVLHDDPARQAALLNDCAPLAAAHLRVVVALIDPVSGGCAQVITLLKRLGIGRAVVIAVGQANRTLVELLEKHPDRFAAASFVADQPLVEELCLRTDHPHIHALLRSGRQASLAKAVIRTRRPAAAYSAVQVWAARIVDGCRSGIKNCAGLLARLDLPGLIPLDDGDDEEGVVESC
jgi:pimeloyl-ACP methyl ester carboxylesterase